MSKKAQKSPKDLPLNYSADWFTPTQWLLVWSIVGVVHILAFEVNKIGTLLFFVAFGSLVFVRNIIARYTGIFLPELLLFSAPALTEENKKTCEEYQLYRVPDIFTIIFYEAPRRIWKIIKRWRNK